MVPCVINIIMIVIPVSQVGLLVFLTDQHVSVQSVRTALPAPAGCVEICVRKIKAHINPSMIVRNYNYHRRL